MVYKTIGPGVGDEGYSRATDNKHQKQSNFLNARHLQAEYEREGKHQEGNIGDNVGDRSCDIQAIAIDAITRCDGSVPSSFNGIACKDQSEDDGNTVAANDSRNYMEGPYVDCLFVHNAVVENNEGNFGECEGWDVNHGGGEDDLSIGKVSRPGLGY